MINSQRLFAEISQNIASSRTEISQNGKRGLTDIHKQCENFIKHLLNRTYDLQLVNLNGEVINFEGLDIGDKHSGIAFQVSSEKSSAKVDDMLTKVLRYRHYIKFPNVKLFVLGEKQKSYSLNTITSPYFDFDWKTDVVDFDDLLRVIQNFDVHHLKEIDQFLQDELPHTLRELKSEEEPYKPERKNLINIQSSLKNSKMPYYQHCIVRLRFLGQSFSPAILYKELDRFYTGNKRDNLYLFNLQYQSAKTAQQLNFTERLENKGQPDYFREGALRIGFNQIIFETASFTAEELKLTSLITEILALTTLLIFSQQLYPKTEYLVELDFELSSNGKLCLIPQNSHLKLTMPPSFPILNPSPIEFSRILKDTSNATLNNIYKEIIHGFVTENNYGHPFAELNVREQNKVSDWFRSYFSLSLKDLDDE